MTKTIEFTGSHRDRAVVAFAKTEGAEAMHKITHSYTRKYHDLRYVLLTALNQVAAVYRVQQDNSLRRLRREQRLPGQSSVRRRLLLPERPRVLGQ